MALLIDHTCVNCHECAPVCPNEAIAFVDEFNRYMIFPEFCTECVGAHDTPQCASVCPVDCCLPDVEREETATMLDNKYLFVQTALTNKTRILHSNEELIRQLDATKSPEYREKLANGTL